MFKRMMFLLLLSTNVAMIANASSSAQVVSFESFPKLNNSIYYGSFNNEEWKLGAYAFNHAPEITSYFLHLKHRYNIDTIIETGTYQGGTTVVFANIFSEVHTIEINNSNYENSRIRLAPYKNVTCHFGNSPVSLQHILPALKNNRILFYLDAHWHEYWPILDELKVISETHKNNCIIVVDDFKVPGRPDIPYDAYHVGNNYFECSYEYIKAELDKVFTDYTYIYLIPTIKHSRAKLVVIPNSWEY